MSNDIQGMLSRLQQEGLATIDPNDKDRLLLLVIHQLINFDKWRRDVVDTLAKLVEQEKHQSEGIERLMQAQQNQEGSIKGLQEWRQEHKRRKEQGETPQTPETPESATALIPFIGPIIAMFKEHQKPLALGLGAAIFVFITLLAWWLFIQDNLSRIF